MKKLLLIFTMCFTLNTYSQDFTYKIKINNVTNISEAKNITDPIRFKFKAFPEFNVKVSLISLNSNVNVTKDELTSLLSNYGYTILDFSKSMRAQIIKEEKEE